MKHTNSIVLYHYNNIANQRNFERLISLRVFENNVFYSSDEIISTVCEVFCYCVLIMVFWAQNSDVRLIYEICIPTLIKQIFFVWLNDKISRHHKTDQTSLSLNKIIYYKHIRTTNAGHCITKNVNRLFNRLIIIGNNNNLYFILYYNIIDFIVQWIFINPTRHWFYNNINCFTQSSNIA